MYCGCKMNQEVTLGLPCAISLQHQSKPQPLSLQFVCNQGNHSVVKTTNLFLQCTQTCIDCLLPLNLADILQFGRVK